MGPVLLDSGSGTIRQQLTQRLTASIGGGYAQNQVIGSFLPSGSNGHSINGIASLEQQFGQHFNVQLGYTHLHQSYGGIPVISSFPNTNREFFSISYQFSRPLGK